MYPVSDDGSDAPAVAAYVCNSYSATLEDSFDYAGSYSCTMTETQARLMSHDSRVALVEVNAHIYAASAEPNPGWGLDRIDQQTALSPGTGAPNDQYTYNTTNGASDIDAWIVDTGIWAGAADLKGRVVPEWPNLHGSSTDTCKSLHPTYSPVPYTSSDDDDESRQHGTRVASVFGGARWGLAKGVTFHAVKIAPDDGKGNIASLIASLNYVLAHAVSTTATRYSGRRSVVNISHYYLPNNTGGNEYYTPGDKTSVGSTVAKLIAKGIPVVVRAGNNNVDAKNVLPASLSLTYSKFGQVTSTINGVITAGASTYYSNNGVIADRMWTDPSNTSGPSTVGSDYGASITVFAPGNKVFVDWVIYNHITGTRTE